MVSLVLSVDRSPEDVASDNSRGPQYQSNNESDDTGDSYEDDDDDREEAESSPSEYVVKEIRSKKA